MVLVTVGVKYRKICILMKNRFVVHSLRVFFNVSASRDPPGKNKSARPKSRHRKRAHTGASQFFFAIVVHCSISIPGNARRRRREGTGDGGIHPARHRLILHISGAHADSQGAAQPVEKQGP